MLLCPVLDGRLPPQSWSFRKNKGALREQLKGPLGRVGVVVAPLCVELFQRLARLVVYRNDGFDRIRESLPVASTDARCFDTFRSSAISETSINRRRPLTEARLTGGALEP